METVVPSVQIKVFLTFQPRGGGPDCLESGLSENEEGCSSYGLAESDDEGGRGLQGPR